VIVIEEQDRRSFPANPIGDFRKIESDILSKNLKAAPASKEERML
jgi:hypothetical protein